MMTEEWYTSNYFFWGLILVPFILLMIRDAFKKKYCPNCGHVGPVKHHSVGSLGLEIFLWGTGLLTLFFGIGLFILPVAFIYSAWRLFVTKPGCKLCGHQALAPLNSPVALRALEKENQNATQVVQDMVEPLKSSPVTAKDKEPEPAPQEQKKTFKAPPNLSKLTVPDFTSNR